MLHTSKLFIVKKIKDTNVLNIFPEKNTNSPKLFNFITLVSKMNEENTPKKQTHI